MENREQQILSEIKSMMTSIRSQLERLDAKMAELQQIVDPEEFEAESIDISIEDDMPVETMQVVEVQEIPLTSDDDEEDDDLPFAETPAPIEPEVTVEEDAPVEPPFSAVTEITAEPVSEPEMPLAATPILNEVLAPDCAWRKDMPGSPVKDIRSAIGLNDRVIFINLLFKEDAQNFVNTLSKINAMETLDEAVGFISSEHPDWDLNSDLVYRFMMAVRRKVK